MKQPVTSCQCPNQVAAGRPCGSQMTQEDLLCDSCRATRKTPGGTCISVRLPGGDAYHIGTLEPRLFRFISVGDSIAPEVS